MNWPHIVCYFPGMCRYNRRIRSLMVTGGGEGETHRCVGCQYYRICLLERHKTKRLVRRHISVDPGNAFLRLYSLSGRRLKETIILIENV